MWITSIYSLTVDMEKTNGYIGISINSAALAVLDTTWRYVEECTPWVVKTCQFIFHSGIFYSRFNWWIFTLLYQWKRERILYTDLALRSIKLCGMCEISQNVVQCLSFQFLFVYSLTSLWVENLLDSGRFWWKFYLRNSTYSHVPFHCLIITHEFTHWS